MELSGWQHFLAMLVCAELGLILDRQIQITMITLRANAALEAKKSPKKSALVNSLLLESLLFVPVSVVLVFVVVRPLLLLPLPPLPKAQLLRMWAVEAPFSFDGALGLASYGFPFKVFKKFVTQAAENTLAIAAAHDSSEENKQSNEQDKTKGQGVGT